MRAPLGDCWALTFMFEYSNPRSLVLRRDVMRYWRGGRRHPSPRSGHTPKGWLPSLVVWALEVSQAESAYLASGKGRPMMLRAWACLQELECLVPRKARSLRWQRRRVTGSLVGKIVPHTWNKTDQGFSPGLALLSWDTLGK